MQQELLRFGGGGGTTVGPVVLGIMFLAVVLLLVLPRKYIFFPFIAPALLIPFSERIVFLGVHLMMLRVVLLFAWLRMLPELFQKRPESSAPTWKLERAVLLWGAFGTVTFTLFYMDLNALINRVGYLAFTMVGSFFLLRLIIRDRDDIHRAIKAMAVVAMTVAAIMLYERLTGHGIWSSLLMREGKYRAQGPFLHSVLAGAFGGTLFPIFIVLWRKEGARLTALIGLISSGIIIYTSSTSTALLGGAAGILALCAWPLRKKMRLIRWGTVAALCGLQLVMKAPVWALVSRIDLVGGSSGYHRYQLIDQFIRRFSEWWLLGVKSTNDWGWDLWDTSNMYVEWGTTGGLLTFIAFLAVIWCAFRAVGVYRKIAEERGDDAWEMWCLGSALFAHSVAFIGITYFDQTIVSWMMVLAMIAALSNRYAGVGVTSKATVRQSVPSSVRSLRGLAPNSRYAVNKNRRTPRTV